MYNGEWHGEAGRWYGSNCFTPVNPSEVGYVHCLCRHGSRPSAAYRTFATDHEARLQSRSADLPWCGVTCLSLEYTADGADRPMRINHQQKGCCAGNCYCAPAVGIYLALALPVLLGPALHRLASRQPASSLRIPLLDAISQLGILLVIAGVTPTLLLSTRHPALSVLRNGIRVHRFLGFVPLGITLTLLSLRPSLADVRSVVLTTLVLLAYAVVGIGIFMSTAFSSGMNATGIAIASAQAFAHVLLFVSLLPILRRGGTLWQPTREVAAWRLRRLWSIYRVSMALLGSWSLVVVIATMVDPGGELSNLARRSAADAGLEKLYAWSMLVQGVAFSLLRREWRHRFQLRARRMRAPTWRSSVDIVRGGGERRGDLDVDNSLPLHPRGLDGRLQQRPYAASFAQWCEDPPGLGDRLILPRRVSAAIRIHTTQDGSRGVVSDVAAADRSGGDGCADSAARRRTAVSVSQPAADGAGPVSADAVLLGEGGFSVVVRAHLDGALVAAKIAKGGKAGQAGVAESLQREALLMRSAGFHHEHLTTYVGICMVAARPVLVLEHYEGGNLSEALGMRTTSRRRSELIAFSERWRLVPQLASGLAHLHGLGIAHCDIKTSNVLSLPALPSHLSPRLPLPPPCACSGPPSGPTRPWTIHTAEKRRGRVRARSQVLLRPSARHALGHAVLSDFGLAAHFADAVCHGATLRYMAPEVTPPGLESRDGSPPIALKRYVHSMP